ncbi:MAG: hypothetical protein M1334_00230 [Patescibacteria group bacterium]|nr:hypothetical protein [Patescibacteria group bacterium]
MKKTEKKERPAKKQVAVETTAQAALNNAQVNSEIKMVGKGMDALKNYQGDTSDDGKLGAAVNKLKAITLTATPEQVNQKMQYVEESRKELLKQAETIAPYLKDVATAAYSQSMLEQVFGGIEAIINEMPAQEKAKVAAIWIKILCDKLSNNKESKGWIARTAIAIGVAKPAAETDRDAIRMPVNNGHGWQTELYNVGDLKTVVADKFNLIYQFEKDAQFQALKEAQKNVVKLDQALKAGGIAIVHVAPDGKYQGGKIEVKVENGIVYPTGNGYFGSVGFARILAEKKIGIPVGDVETGRISQKLPEDKFRLAVKFIRALNETYMYAKKSAAEREEMLKKVNAEMKDVIKGSAGIAKAFIPSWKAGEKTHHGITFFVEGDGKGNIRIVQTSHKQLFENCMQFRPIKESAYPLKQMLSIK